MDITSLVLKLEERRRQAMLAADLPTLQELLAEDLSYVHSSGSPDNKESYLAKLSGGNLKYLSVDLRSLQVQLLPQAAVVTGRMSAVINMNDQRKNIESVFMTVWSCDSNGVWRLHAHQGTPVPNA